MKNRPWLEVSENVLLFGSGVGSVASVVSQQLVYAAAPLSLFLLLNLVNRRRFEQFSQAATTASLSQLDHRLSTDIGAIRQQVLSLPNLLDLSGLRKTILQKNQEAIANLHREMGRRLDAFEEQGLNVVRQDVNYLRDQYNNLNDAVAGVNSYLHRLASITRVEGMESSLNQLKADLAQLQNNLQALANEPKPNFNLLQDQINHLHRRFNNLPPPFDSNSLKQDLDSLIKLVGDLVPRREMARLTVDVEQLQRQQHTVEQSVAPLRLALTIVKRQLDEINTRLKLLPDGQASQELLSEFQVKLALLEQRLDQLPTSTLSEASSRESLLHLLDSSAFQMQLESLAVRLEGVEDYMAGVQKQVKETLPAHLPVISGSGPDAQVPPQYDLVFALKEPQPEMGPDTQSIARRSILQEVLQQTREHILVVLPSLTEANFGPALIQQFRAFLNRKGKIEMGLGHLGETYQSRIPRWIDYRSNSKTASNPFLYQALSQLTQLKRQYPKQFKFKILGTHENFMVCDRTLAILGVHNIATANTVFPDLEVGLRTTDQRVLQGLLQRFQHPSLDPEDAVSYFNRAMTRYELGDKPGAIEDYTQVLQVNPLDDIACNNRGLIQYELGQQREALADFSQTLQINPFNVAAYCNRGLVGAELGDKLGAIEDYSKAIQLDSDFAAAYFYRGLARTRLGNKLGAIEDYSEVIRIDPQSALAYFYRGLARTKLGDKAGAMTDLLQAADLFLAEGHQANYKKAMDTVAMLRRVSDIGQTRQVLVSREVDR